MLIEKKRSFPIFPAHPNLRSNDSEIHFFLLSVFDQRSIGASCRIKLLSDSEAQTPVIMSGNFVFASNTWPFCSHICMRHFQIRTQIHRKNNHVRDVTAVKLGKYPDHEPKNWSYRFPHLLLLHHLHLLLFAHVHDSSHLCHSSDAALGDVMNQTKEFLSQESNQPTQTNQQRSPIHLILPFKSFQKLKS